MIELKCSKFITLKVQDYIPEIDLQVRQYEDHARIIYLGQGMNVIQLEEGDIDKLYEFLKQAKELELDKKSIGWLK
jgi:hypothetical protein